MYFFRIAGDCCHALGFLGSRCCFPNIPDPQPPGVMVAMSRLADDLSCLAKCLGSPLKDLKGNHWKYSSLGGHGFDVEICACIQGPCYRVSRMTISGTISGMIPLKGANLALDLHFFITI